MNIKVREALKRLSLKWKIQTEPHFLPSSDFSVSPVASEKKIKKIKFSGRLLPFFKTVILPCKISLKMLQNTKNGIAPPNGVQSKNRFHGWIRRWILTYLDPKSVEIPQKLPILDNRKILGLEGSCKKLHGSKIGHFWGIETLFGSK